MKDLAKLDGQKGPKGSIIHGIATSADSGLFRVVIGNRKFFVSARIDPGWEIVSVAPMDKNHQDFENAPTVEEMHIIKDLFYKENEWAVQYYTEDFKKATIHSGFLHLFRPARIELPPDFP